MSEKKESNTTLTLNDWMLVAKHAMHYADASIREFEKRHMPMFGACGTAADKYIDLARELTRTAELLHKIEPIAMLKIAQKKEDK